MVAAVVVMLRPSVIRPVAFVPAVREGFHGLRLAAVQPLEESGVDHLAVVSGASLVDPDRPSDLAFMCGHYVDQVAEALRVVVASVCSLQPDVDVDSAAS